MSELDRRDVKRAEHGQLPIFVTDPRLLTEEEMDSMWGVGVRPKEFGQFEPCVKDGYVHWRRRT